MTPPLEAAIKKNAIRASKKSYSCIRSSKFFKPALNMFAEFRDLDYIIPAPPCDLDASVLEALKASSVELVFAKQRMIKKIETLILLPHRPGNFRARTCYLAELILSRTKAMLFLSSSVHGCDCRGAQRHITPGPVFIGNRRLHHNHGLQGDGAIVAAVYDGAQYRIPVHIGFN